MGGGKSVATLTAFDEMRSGFEVNRMLVAAPKRVARSVWKNEIETWDHLRHLRISRIQGTVAERIAAIRTPADVYTVGRHNLKWLTSLYMPQNKQRHPWPWDMVVLDESQSYKSQGSERYKAAKKARAMSRRLLELTGTPSPNGLADLWAQMFLIDYGQRLGAGESDYKTRWFDPPGWESYKWTPKPHAKDQIYEKIADVVLTLREKDYFDLPPVVVNLVPVQLSDKAMQVYRKFERQYVMETWSGRTVTAVSAGVCVGKRMQLANGSIYVDDAGRYEEFHPEKLNALVELIDGASGPVMVVYNFRSDLKRIEDRLAEEYGKNLTVERLDSEESEERWNRGETDVLILHPESAGHGLNLQASGCEHIIWFGLTYNLEHLQQVLARLGGGHRRGDRALVVSYILAEETIDYEALNNVDMKALTQNDLIDGVDALVKRRETT